MKAPFDTLPTLGLADESYEILYDILIKIRLSKKDTRYNHGCFHHFQHSDFEILWNHGFLIAETQPILK